MKSVGRLLTVLAAVILWPAAHAEPLEAFSFGVIPGDRYSHAQREMLHQALQEADAANLAFVVLQGIKHAPAPCTDETYGARLRMLEQSKHGLIVSVSAGDWARCTDARGRSLAPSRLARVRELFFFDEFSLGSTRLPLVRQSTEAKFLGFVENARWEIGDTMFATINLPANNNHFVMAAGRNGEFEDRLVANKEWLRRVFTYAKLKKIRLVVLFSDANPLSQSANARRDGFSETRQHLRRLATQFPGHTLLVHGEAGTARQKTQINWQGKLGEIAVRQPWARFDVSASAPVPVRLHRSRDQ